MGLLLPHSFLVSCIQSPRYGCIHPSASIWSELQIWSESLFHPTVNPLLHRWVYLYFYLVSLDPFYVFVCTTMCANAHVYACLPMKIDLSSPQWDPSPKQACPATPPAEFWKGGAVGDGHTGQGETYLSHCVPVYPGLQAHLTAPPSTAQPVAKLIGRQEKCFNANRTPWVHCFLSQGPDSMK